MQKVLTYISSGQLLDLEQKLTFLDTVNTEYHSSLLSKFQQYLYKKGLLPYINAKALHDMDSYSQNGNTDSLMLDIGGYFSIYIMHHSEEGLMAPYILLNMHPKHDSAFASLEQGIDYLLQDKNLVNLVETF